MDTFLPIREICTEGFKNLGNFMVGEYFRMFAWFCCAMYLIVLSAFLFRLTARIIKRNNPSHCTVRIKIRPLIMPRIFLCAQTGSRANSYRYPVYGIVVFFYRLI